MIIIVISDAQLASWIGFYCCSLWHYHSLMRYRGLLCLHQLCLILSHFSLTLLPPSWVIYFWMALNKKSNVNITQYFISVFLQEKKTLSSFIIPKENVKVFYERVILCLRNLCFFFSCLFLVFLFFVYYVVMSRINFYDISKLTDSYSVLSVTT